MPLNIRMHVPPRDRQVLESWARSASAPGLAQRALIVLLAADGAGTSEIVGRTGVSKPTVNAWKKRYAAEGLGGLQDRRKPGRPRRTDDAAIVLATLEPPPERLGVKHWSSRLLAGELGMSNVKVAETWRQYGLEPWRREPFTFSTDPRLAAVARAVTGLYLNPPDHAIALCAADGRGRHGATALLASLQASMSSGATPAGYPRRRHQEFLHFLQLTAAGCPRAKVHVVAVDNYATRRHPEVRAWLARHSRITPHFTPNQRSWLTLAEVFAGLNAGTRDTGRSDAATSVTVANDTVTNDTGLGAAIATVIGSWTDRSQPFAWTRPADELCDCPSADAEVSLANPAERP
jgi:transposase